MNLQCYIKHKLFTFPATTTKMNAWIKHMEICKYSKIYTMHINVFIGERKLSARFWDSYILQMSRVRIPFRPEFFQA